MEKIVNFFRGLRTKISSTSRLTLWLWGLIIVLVSFIIVTAVFWYGQEKERAQAPQDQNINEQISDEENIIEEVNPDVMGDQELSKEITSEEFKKMLADYPVKQDNTVGEISVNTDSWPIKLSEEEWSALLLDRLDENLKKQLVVSGEILSANWSVFKIGVIADGPFKGESVFMLASRFLIDGPVAPNFWRFVPTSEKLVLLSSDSGQVAFDLSEDFFAGEYNSYFATRSFLFEAAVLRSLFSVNQDILVRDEVFSDVKITGSDFYLKQIKAEDYNNFYNLLYNDKLIEIKMKYATNRSVFFNGNCLMAGASDGIPDTLYISHPLFNYKENIYNGMPEILNFTFLDGTKNKVGYNGKVMGCSFVQCLNYIGDTVKLSDLKKVGTTPAGDFVYELADVNFTIKNDLYYAGDEYAKKSLLRQLYDSTYFPEGSKESFEDFVANHPILFWQDPFGEWVELQNAHYSPAAECAKPVVYLYPEQEMDVSVKVEPTGGLTVTEPAYNNGWVVKAKPTGELYNYADGQNYPYLFWEGFGLNYNQFDQGFVVERENVEKFLREILAKQGLVNNEIDEFVEFWAPKMTEKPYYFISFMPQQLFDVMAPLDIEPKPDTVIRVFMGYRGLDNKIEVRAPRIITPVRRGFTVVEWGGALNKD